MCPYDNSLLISGTRSLIKVRLRRGEARKLRLLVQDIQSQEDEPSATWQQGNSFRKGGRPWFPTNFSSSKQNLGAGESKIFFVWNFTFSTWFFWGNDRIWRSYFGDGLVQPPTRTSLWKKGMSEVGQNIFFWEGMVWLLGWGTKMCFCLPRYKEFCLVKFSCFVLCLDWKGRVKTCGFSPKGKQHISYVLFDFYVLYPFFQSNTTCLELQSNMERWTESFCRGAW